MKYIIKNCPATYIFKSGYSCNNLDYDEHKFCKDINDCTLKRIAKLCNRYQQRCQVCPTHDVCFECESVSGKQLSDDILNLLEIQEFGNE